MGDARDGGTTASLLTVPPLSTGGEDECKDQEKPTASLQGKGGQSLRSSPKKVLGMLTSPRGNGRLSLRRSPKKVLGMPVSPQVKHRRLPLRCAPQNLARLANAEAGPSCLLSVDHHMLLLRHATC
jgi:hypothetical protein